MSGMTGPKDQKVPDRSINGANLNQAYSSINWLLGINFDPTYFTTRKSAGGCSVSLARKLGIENHFRQTITAPNEISINCGKWTTSTTTYECDKGSTGAITGTSGDYADTFDVTGISASGWIIAYLNAGTCNPQFTATYPTAATIGVTKFPLCRVEWNSSGSYIQRIEPLWYGGDIVTGSVPVLDLKSINTNDVGEVQIYGWKTAADAAVANAGDLVLLKNIVTGYTEYASKANLKTWLAIVAADISDLGTYLGTWTGANFPYDNRYWRTGGNLTTCFGSNIGRDGTNVVIDLANALLVEDGVGVADWANGVLKSITYGVPSTSLPSLNWKERKAYAADGTTETIDWTTTRKLSGAWQCTSSMTATEFDIDANNYLKSGDLHVGATAWLKPADLELNSMNYWQPGVAGAGFKVLCAGAGTFYVSAAGDSEINIGGGKFKVTVTDSYYEIAGTMYAQGHQTIAGGTQVVLGTPSGGAVLCTIRNGRLCVD